jgi:hypothetical protein
MKYSTNNIVLRFIYFVFFIFFTWLALATRSHHQWFCAFVVEYGGDTIWAGMFLFFLRIFFKGIQLWKLALINYALGVADEVSQLYKAPWIESIRATRLGGLMLGHTFVWSDIVCYGVGTLMAFIVILVIENIIVVSE